MHPDTETRIFSLAQPLEEPDRLAFIKAATEAVETLGPNADGPGAVHRLLAPLWRQFFHPPSETSPPNRSRAYHPDDDAEARALTKFAREADRQTEEVRRIRYRRKRYTARLRGDRGSYGHVVTRAGGETCGRGQDHADTRN
jgi:hypothetical protein